LIGAEHSRKIGPGHGFEAQYFGVDQRASVRQCLSPAAALVEDHTVKGDDGTDPALRGDVFAPLQFGQCFAQRATADVEFLSQLMLTGQQKAVLHEATFDAPDELVDHPLFLVESYLSNHVQSDNRNVRGWAREI